MNLSIMIKPASSLCNLRCRYCFYHDLAQNRSTESYGIMQEKTLQTLLERAFESFPATGRHTLSLIFQGGEPMIAGLPFFESLEELLSKMKRPGIQVFRSLQTNGTLINDDWASFFAKHRYLLGVSLDGIADIHNDLRIDPQGKGSFNRVISGIACLKRHGVDYNILTVVTAQVARHPRKVYSFLRKNGWDYLQFIPCIDPISGEQMDFSLSPEQYGRFLVDIFHEYEQELMSGRRISVRWFDNLIDLAAGRQPESCGMTGVCACHFVAEADGSVYPCDFYVEDAYRLGSVQENSFREMFEGEVARNFIRESTLINEKCRDCQWIYLCRGGCRRYREITRGNIELNQLCRAYEIFFESCGLRIMSIARALNQY